MTVINSPLYIEYHLIFIFYSNKCPATHYSGQTGHLTAELGED